MKWRNKRVALPHRPVLASTGTASWIVEVPAAGGGGGGGGGGPLVTEQTLTAPVTTVTPPAAPANQLWVAYIKQDATGGRAVVWHPSIVNAPMIGPSFGNADPNTMCIVTFFGRTSAAQWNTVSSILGIPAS